MNNPNSSSIINIYDHTYDTSTNTLTIGKGITELNEDTLDELIDGMKPQYNKNQISNNNLSSNEKCAICFAEWNKNNKNKRINKLVKLKCGHFFHKKCIKGWFKHNKTCPVCRDNQSINSKDNKIIIKKINFKQDNDLLKIGDNTFKENKDLISVDLSKATKLTTIGYKTFYDCYELTGELKLPESLTYIDEHAFYSCTGITELKLPNNLIHIGKGAFYGCYNITGELKLPNSLTHIDNGAFYDCTGIKELKLPESLKKISKGVFYACTGITNLKLPDSLTKIDEDAFYYCTGITELKLPNSLIHIGKGAFYGCYNITGELKLPNSLTHIDNGAFSDCTGIKELKLPESLTHIGEGAFKECNGITELNLSNTTNLTKIDSNAFEMCNSIETITISSNICKIINYPSNFIHYKIKKIIVIINNKEKDIPPIKPFLRRIHKNNVTNTEIDDINIVYINIDKLILLLGGRRYNTKRLKKPKQTKYKTKRKYRSTTRKSRRLLKRKSKKW